MRIPIVLTIYNRPEAFSRILDVLRSVKPHHLFVIADGPRLNRLNDAERCARARSLIEEIDWPCEIATDYAEENLGCGKRMATGISWVFEQTDEAIILEDDCLPDPTFFRFCEELLVKYRNEERVMMISGTNSLLKWKADVQSYHFSFYGSIWGWATWRRAWKAYDYDMKGWEKPESKVEIREVLADQEQFLHRVGICERAFRQEIDTWDYQWSFARLRKGGLSVVPSVNLVSNIGFGKEATHTDRPLAMAAHLCRYALDFPLREPSYLAVDRAYDREYFLWQIRRPNADMVLRQSEKLLDAKQHIHAFILLQAAIAAGIDDIELHLPRIHYLKARALLKLGNVDKAREALDDLLFLMPTHGDGQRLRKSLA